MAGGSMGDNSFQTICFHVIGVLSEIESKRKNTYHGIYYISYSKIRLQCSHHTNILTNNFLKYTLLIKHLNWTDYYKLNLSDSASSRFQEVLYLLKYVKWQTA